MRTDHNPLPATTAESDASPPIWLVTPTCRTPSGDAADAPQLDRPEITATLRSPWPRVYPGL